MIARNASQSLAQAERLWMQGHLSQARRSCLRARMNYHKDRDAAGEAQAVLLLGEMDLAGGDVDAARARFVEARTLLVRGGDSRHQGGVLLALGKVAATVHQHVESRAHFAAAVAHYRGAGDLDGEAEALRGLAEADRALGRDDLALEGLVRARRIARDIGDGLAEAAALRALAVLHAANHHADQAHEALEQAVELYGDYGDHLDQAGAMAEMAALLRGLGDDAGALESLRKAARLHAEAGDLEGEADVLMDLAALEQGRDPASARRHYTHAATLFASVGQPMLGEAARDAARAVGGA